MKKKIILKRVGIIVFLILFIIQPSEILYGSYVRADAATFMDINQNSVFVKQEMSGTCTLASAVMLLRRTAMMAGYDWTSISESSVKPVAWTSGLLSDFTYNGIRIVRGLFGSNPKEELIQFLTEHPEGIVAYDKDRPHAVLITDYTDGIFYCADPAKDSRIPCGRIPVTSLNINLDHIEKYWYAFSPDVSLNADIPVPSTVIGGVKDVSGNVPNSTEISNENTGTPGVEPTHSITPTPIVTPTPVITPTPVATPTPVPTPTPAATPVITVTTVPAITGDKSTELKLVSYKKNAKKVTGSGIYGNKVCLIINTKYYSAYVGKDGKWSVTVPKLKAGLKITVYSKNSAGTNSKVITVTVK